MARLGRCRDLLRFSEESFSGLEGVNSQLDDTVRAVFFEYTKRD